MPFDRGSTWWMQGDSKPRDGAAKHVCVDVELDQQEVLIVRGDREGGNSIPDRTEPIS